MKRSHAFAAIGVLSLFLVPALSVLAADIDSGLRVNDSTGIVHVAGSTIPGDSELRIKTATGVTGVLLVAPTDPLASKAKINTASGVKALKKFVGAPSMPTGLATTSVTCGGNVGLSWSTSASANFYTIYRGGVRLATTTALTFADSGLTVSTSYTYSISASNDAGESALATLTTLSSASCTPSVPVISVNTDPTCGGRIIISWSAVPIATSYKIYRNGTLATTTTSISYTDTGLTVSTNYTYTVAASNAAGDSATSTTAAALSSASCLPSVPSGLGAVAESACASKKIDLSWIPSNNTSSYIVYRYGANTAGSVTVSTTTSTIPGTYVGEVIVDTVANDGTLYRYTVVAIDGLGHSATSSSASAISANMCPPAAGPILTAVSGSCLNGGNKVNLSWTAVAGATGYTLYSDSGIGLFSAIYSTTTPPTAASPYIRTSLNAGYAETYYVLATNGGGSSPITTQATVASSFACQTTLNFWPTSLGDGNVWPTSGAYNKNYLTLNWNAVNASYCDGSGDGNVHGDVGIWGQSVPPGHIVAWDPSVKVGLNTTNTLWTVYNGTNGTPSYITHPTMYSLACVNSAGQYGDNISLSIRNSRDFGNGAVAGISFAPARPTSGDFTQDSGYSTTNHTVNGIMTYGCLTANTRNLFEYQPQGTTTWTQLNYGTNILPFSTAGALQNQSIGLTSAGKRGVWMGKFDGSVTYRITCYDAVDTAGYTVYERTNTPYKNGFSSMTYIGRDDKAYTQMTIRPRADSTLSYPELGWFPTLVQVQEALVFPIYKGITDEGWAGGSYTMETHKYSFSCTNASKGTMYRSGAPFAGSVDGTVNGTTTTIGSSLGTMIQTSYTLKYPFQFNCDDVMTPPIMI